MRKILIALLLVLVIPLSASKLSGRIDNLIQPWGEFTDSVIVHDYFRIYDSSGNLQFQFDNSTGEVSQRWEHFACNLTWYNQSQRYWSQAITVSEDHGILISEPSINRYKVDTIYVDSIQVPCYTDIPDSIAIDSIAFSSSNWTAPSTRTTQTDWFITNDTLPNGDNLKVYIPNSTIKWSADDMTFWKLHFYITEFRVAGDVNLRLYHSKIYGRIFRDL